MTRPLLLLLVPALASCQGNGSPHPAAPAASSSADPFNRDTVQTYDIQTGEFQQHPPYGARSNQPQ